MIYRFSTILVVFILTFQCLHAQKYMISGRVIEADSELPYGGATVTIADQGFGAISDLEGMFDIKDIPRGSYLINFYAPGFERSSQNIKLTKNLDLGLIALFKMKRGIQEVETQKTTRAFSISNLIASRPNLLGGNMIYGMAPEPKMLMGSFFIDANWNEGALFMYKDDEVKEDILVRYRIDGNSFDLKDRNTDYVRNIPGIWVETFIMIDEKSGATRFFINGKDYLIDKEPASGFFELLVDGSIPLLKKTDAIYKRSNYNTALMVGNKNDKIVKKETLYYISDNQFVKVPTSKKKLLNVFSKKREEMDTFIKTNILALRKERDVVTAFTHFNKIYQGQ